MGPYVVFDLPNQRLAGGQQRPRGVVCLPACLPALSARGAVSHEGRTVVARVRGRDGDSGSCAWFSSSGPRGCLQIRGRGGFLLGSLFIPWGAQNSSACGNARAVIW